MDGWMKRFEMLHVYLHHITCITSLASLPVLVVVVLELGGYRY